MRPPAALPGIRKLLRSDPEQKKDDHAAGDACEAERRRGGAEADHERPTAE
jgi:hypothetical protein